MTRSARLSALAVLLVAALALCAATHALDFGQLLDQAHAHETFNSAVDSVFEMKPELLMRLRTALWDREPLAETVGDGNAYFDFLPTFVAGVRPGAAPSTWSAPCFQANTAVATTSSKGVHVEIDVQNARSTLCSDLYLVATTDHFAIKDFFVHGKHTVDFTFKDADEAMDVALNGVRIFQFRAELLGTLIDAWDTIQLFLGNNLPENNVKFLKEKAGMNLTPRSTGVIELDESDVQSGDYIGITRLDGLDPMIMWGTGTMFGHTAMVLEVDGVKYVVESTDKNPFGKVYWPPPYGIIRTPFKQWMKQAVAAEYMVVVARLSPEVRARWNQPAAEAFFKSVEGVPYGYENFVYGWMDTLEKNFPPPLSGNTLAVALSVADHFIGADIKRVFIDGMNQRFRTYFGSNTTCSNMACAFEFFDKHNITLMDVVILPELDEWKYTNGPSMVCDVFVTAVYKHAGVFGSIGSLVQATEQHPRDVYQMKIYDASHRWPAPCPQDRSWCQIMGDYNLDVPGFNTVPPYPHMNERCESQPTEYARVPVGC